MAIPDYETLMLPVLRAFGEGATNVSECLPLLREEFGLSDDEMAEMLPSGRVRVIASRAHWARTYLSKAGLLASPRRNHHEITDLGRRMLAQSPERIDNETLSRFEGFEDWRRRGDRSQDVDGSQIEKERPVKHSLPVTPDELVSQAVGDIEAALAADLLDLLHSMAPVRFERLILDLLTAMGYGAGELGSHHMTKASNDGGIDGIIHEDALGLDAVYIQAKRYAADNKVSRPAIQQFVGSLTGEGATKGVFVTTSDFSSEARDYLRKVQHRIVLINGRELTRLMIKHGVGVRVATTYVVKRVDETYFDDAADA